MFKSEAKKKQYTFNYQMGILRSLSYLEEDFREDFKAVEVEVDLTHLRILVSNVRVITSQNLVYFGSRELGEGHLFMFDLLTPGNGFMVRKLSNVENSHLLSNNGVFMREKYTRALFHYFQESADGTFRLVYSLSINFRKAYFSIKSKTLDTDEKSVTIFATDGFSNSGN